MKKRLFSVLLALCMVLTALPLTGLTAFAATSGNFEYFVLSVVDKTCEITDYTGSATKLTIPSELDGYTVTSISNYAFSDCNSLTDIVIAPSISNIGYEAFCNCSSLTSITIPDSVTSIGQKAFYNTAYYNDNDNWKNDVLYIGNHCIIARPDISGTCAIEAGTKTIATCAFNGCSLLTSITIPDSVIIIGPSAFRDCDSLTDIVIPDSVTDIEIAFADCDSLESITVDSENPSYSSENGVLFSKDKTELLQYPAGKQDTAYTIPDSVTSIGEEAFYNCYSLESIAIPNSVTHIGSFTFSYTAYYNNDANWENDVLYIGNHCIEAGYDVAGAYAIKAGTITIADDAFFGHYALTSIMIPDSVIGIGAYAFYQCSSITSITIGDSVSSIGESALSDCYSLENITVSDENTSYSSEHGVLFNKDKTELIQYPVGKTDIAYTVPSSVTSIGFYAFGSCYALEGVTIPNNVIYIGDYAFSYCDNLTIYGYTGSTAEAYAAAWNIPFVMMETVTDSASGVTVECVGEVLPKNVQLVVKQVEMVENSVTYDITLTQNGAAIQPAGAVTVMIPVPETMDGNQCRVYREEADGTYTNMRAVYRDGYMVFTTDHFSQYVLMTAVLSTTLGDVNGDGTVDAVDARWVLQAAAGMRTLENDTADVNGDGKIDAVDARWILQAAAGMRTLDA